MAGDGLSVKERLALLQTNNKNQLLAGQIKQASPGGPGGGEAGGKGSPNPSKPRPPPGPKPGAPGRVALKPRNRENKEEGEEESGKVNGKPDDANSSSSLPAFPKMRPVPGGGGKVLTPPVAKKPGSVGSGGGESSGVSVGVSEGGVKIRDKSHDPDCGQSEPSPRPTSIQERMAALRRRAEGDGADSSSSSSSSFSSPKPQQNQGASSSPSPMTSAKPTVKSPPLPTKPNLSQFANGSNKNNNQSDNKAQFPKGKNVSQNGSATSQSSEDTKTPFTPLKPSELIRSINQAADQKVKDDKIQKEEEGVNRNGKQKKDTQDSPESDVTLRKKRVDRGKDGSDTVSAASAEGPTKTKSRASEESMASSGGVATSGGVSGRRSQTYERHCDGKRFRPVSAASARTSFPAPPKPPKLEDVDLQTFVRLYAKAKEAKLVADGAGGADEADNGEFEELYVEAESEAIAVEVKRSSIKRALSTRVSKLPEFTEEEEEFENTIPSGLDPADLPGQEEIYDDCESAKQVVENGGDADEIYEPLDEHLDLQMSDSSTPPPLPSPNPDSKRTKDKEKEKEKEKTGKKKEKERKKKEDLKKLRAKFGLGEKDEKVGDGVVKSNAGAGLFSRDLPVVKGEIIAILRMDGNPQGKWLVQTDAGKIGYVNSNNIEVGTPTIRHVMGSLKMEPLPSPDNQEEMYEPLPDGDSEEIYEEV